MTELIFSSLRDRKRAETWSMIHTAAAGLTLDKGLECVTVEEIAEQANISSRTFFNYFATKEDAILGLQEPIIEDHVREEFVLADNFLDQVSRLLLTVAQSTFGGDYAASQRFEILARYPELLQRRIAYIGKVESLVATLVRERLDESASWSADLADLPASDTAQVIVLMGSATMRFAMQHGSPPTSTAQLDALNSATDIFRRILRKVI